MSADVQPRKRKDKKRKREDDESSHGVHITKMGSEDMHLHVHEDHGTGGHWCAKIVFFTLTAILAVLIGLIIIEQRGLAELDNRPLKESRFANYFDGWVEENGQHADEHDPVQASIEEHEEHDEPFEEDEEEIPSSEDHDDVEYVADADEPAVENEPDAEDVDVDNSKAAQADTDDIDGDGEGDGDGDIDVAVDVGDDEEDNDEEEIVQVSASTLTSASKNTNTHDDEDDEDDEDDYAGGLEDVVDNDADELPLLKRAARRLDDDDDDDEQKSKQKQSTLDDNDSTNINDNDNNDDDNEDNKSNDSKPSHLNNQGNDLDPNYEELLEKAGKDLTAKNYYKALEKYETLTAAHPDQPAAMLGLARTLDHLAMLEQSNAKLKQAIAAMKRYLSFELDALNETEYISTAELCIERMRFLGFNTQTVHIIEQLIEAFDNTPKYRHELAKTYLISNDLKRVREVTQETLRRWPSDGLAMLHYGFAIKQHELETAAHFMRKGFKALNESRKANIEGVFYYALGDALQRLGRHEEAYEIYASYARFPTPYQRSLYNEPKLRAQPIWTKAATGYDAYFDKLEQNWQAIRDEGLYLLSRQDKFTNESEDLTAAGDWKMYELYMRGQPIEQHCKQAPITCGLIAQFPAASGCRRGQVKFSAMLPNTHVWPHCGPTNCRLRGHLGLLTPPGVHMRVVNQTLTWSEGKFIIFDDSFEHEVWHNGTTPRLVLIVDVWHPDLSATKRRIISDI